MVLIICGASFWSCSKDKREKPEKGAIEKITEKTGKEIADKLQKPIKNARAVKNKQEERAKEIEKTLNGQ